MRKKYAQQPRVNSHPLVLTKKELSELFFEGVITLLAVFIIYIGILFILDQLLDTPIVGVYPDSSIRQMWHLQYSTILFYRKVYNILSFIFGIGFTYWRLLRRYKQMQLHHVLKELHKIADGNYDARIPFQLHGDMGKVVNSINRLVDSTVKAMEEERLIEQSKDELITNVSHDLRTPLTSIIGYLGLVTSGKYEIGEDAKHYASIAYNKAEQMKILVDELFEYTTMRPGGFPLRLHDVPIHNFLAQIAAEFELDAQKRQMMIELLPTATSLVLEIDPEKMVRVITNLLSNAIKYGKEGKKIILEAKEENQMVIIAVRNSGPTIPQEQLAKLFHRFYRIEASRSKETGGTGLGLAIAENIVHMHGGFLYAESDENLTSFYICLPSENQKALNKKSFSVKK